LRPSPYGGTTAVALMPNSIVVPASETELDTDPDLHAAADRLSGLDLDHADALALTGRRPVQPSLPEGATRRTEALDDGFGRPRPLRPEGTRVGRPRPGPLRPEDRRRGPRPGGQSRTRHRRQRGPRPGAQPAGRRHLPRPAAPRPPGKPEPAFARQLTGRRPGGSFRRHPAIPDPEPGGGTQPR